MSALLAAAPSTGELRTQIRNTIASDLPPLVDGIDHGTHYPAEFLRKIGSLGAFSTHVGEGKDVDLNPAINIMSDVAGVCGATGFMAWCQDTLVWYLLNTENETLKANMLGRAADARLLGGTGLSNPMKSFFGIEKLRLKAHRVEGGYMVSGSLPWVSNLGPDHVFGTICDCDGEKVMFIADCSNPQIELMPCEPFLAMDGTGTFGIKFNHAFVSDDLVLSHQAMTFVKKIRAGFVLLQAGMAIGIMRDCIDIMMRTKTSLGHVNKFLVTQQPEDFAAELERLAGIVQQAARMPYETSDDFWRTVVRTRLEAGEACMAAAHAAMLHTGARGYLKSHRAQRRMREAYFVGIVTPATKQLRKMLAEMAA